MSTGRPCGPKRLTVANRATGRPTRNGPNLWNPNQGAGRGLFTAPTRWRCRLGTRQSTVGTSVPYRADGAAVKRRNRRGNIQLVVCWAHAPQGEIAARRTQGPAALTPSRRRTPTLGRAEDTTRQFRPGPVPGSLLRGRRHRGSTTELNSARLNGSRRRAEKASPPRVR